jgi:hypothetical protein
MMGVPLKSLVVDASHSSAVLLCDSLRGLASQVLTVEKAMALPEAWAVLKARDVNTIFIDPLSFGLDVSSDFIFRVRRVYPSIVFVLFLDFAAMERGRHEFFAGERKRFSHYYKLDKATPATIFREEILATVNKCQAYLSYALTEESIGKLQAELGRIESGRPARRGDEVQFSLGLLQEISQQLKLLTAEKRESESPVRKRSIFLSYRFAEAEYVDGLKSLLELAGFTIVTGQETNTYIGQAILARIKAAEFFLCLMTRAEEKANGKYTTSPWLLEEKGAALALGKRIVLMVEEGVEDVGGLQGDWQQIRFSGKGFIKAAIQAVDQLKSYTDTK